MWFERVGTNLLPLGPGNLNNVMPPANTTTIYVAQRTDAATGCMVQREVAITVNPPDLTSLLGERLALLQYRLTVCEGTQLHLQTNVDPIFIQWERVSDGQMLSEDPTITATTNDIFRAHAWDPTCGDVALDLELIVQTMPTLQILAQAPICAGTSVHLTSIPNASRWYLIDETRIFMPQTPQATQTYVGVYVSGHCEVRDTITVVVENPLDFIAGPQNQTINQGQSILLWSTPDALEWFEEATSAPLTSLNVSPVTTTTYIARWETAICGTLFDTVTINVNAPTVLNLEIASGNGCANGEGWAEVTVLNGVAPFTFAWSHTATTALIENLMPGTYSVVVTDALGVTGATSTTISAVSQIQMTFQTHVATNEMCDNGRINVTVAGGIPPYYFEWTVPWDSTFIHHGQHLLNATAGIYYLSVIDSAGCERQQHVILPCVFHRVMPSILLTPNNDGLNDFIRIRDIEFYPINTVTIISSYGEEIIRIQNYNNRDRVWDGRNRRGRIVPDGTYYYVIEAEGVRPMAGWIIVRGSGSR